MVNRSTNEAKEGVKMKREATDNLENEKAEIWSEEYYFSGKSFKPKKSLLLCRYTELKDAFFYKVCTTDIYATKSGLFYMITGIAGDGVEDFLILTKEAALSYLDQHPAEINKTNYNKVFGKPEEA